MDLLIAERGKVQGAPYKGRHLKKAEERGKQKEFLLGIYSGDINYTEKTGKEDDDKRLQNPMRPNWRGA